MIKVMGAGAFGTALAVSLARNGAVALWARDPEHAEDMKRRRENRRRLPGVELPENIAILSGDDAAGQHAGHPDAILLAVPMQKLRGFLEEHRTALDGALLVACCKGVELTTGRRPTQIITDIMPGGQNAILTGPSFAADIARGLPTALTLACVNGQVGRALQQSLTTPNLRIYRSADVAGAELGGALKNVMAIACGAAIGAGLGESARAALMTRGFAEMSRMAVTTGAAPETLAGLSGFGDLVLTSTSDQSRNYRYGLSLGTGEAFDTAMTVEGAATARAVRDHARTAGVDMPITRAVTALIDGELRVKEAMDILLSRPLKEE